MNKIEGQKITKIRTLGSWFDMDSIELIDDKGNRFRMKVKELYKIINDLMFQVKQKKKYKYLEIEVL